MGIKTGSQVGARIGALGGPLGSLLGAGIGAGVGALFGLRNKNKKFAKKAMKDPALQAWIQKNHPQAAPVLAKLAQGGKLTKEEKAMVSQIRKEWDQVKNRQPVTPQLPRPVGG